MPLPGLWRRCKPSPQPSPFGRGSKSPPPFRGRVRVGVLQPAIPMTNKTSPILHHARRMRHEPTKSERLLWKKLRGRQLGGCKFRRQHPIAPYIVDFYCAQTKLIIELDGDIHAYQEAYDAERTAYLKTQGYLVIRFWNNQVFQEMDGVLNAILDACDSPSPQPSPQRGEGANVPSP